MNAPMPHGTRVELPLALRLLGLLAPAAADEDAAAEARWLVLQAQGLPAAPQDPQQILAQWAAHAPPHDAPLRRMCQALRLNGTEQMAVALAHAADTDLVASRALAWLQAPLRDAYPTLGLLACLDAQRGLAATQSLAALADGAAVRCGLLQIDTQPGRALPDARLRIGQPLVVALSGGTGSWSGVTLQQAGGADAFPASMQAGATQQARQLDAGACLVVRSGHPREARTACLAMAGALGRPAAFIEGDLPFGLVPWLLLQHAVPVLCAELGPGERRRVPVLEGGLPLLVATGLEGAWEGAGTGPAVASWTVPLPGRAERAALWTAQGAGPRDAQELASTYRHGFTRIADLGQAADAWRRHEGAAALQPPHVARAARARGCGTLGHLAQLLGDDIDADALILPPPVERELHALLARCRVRDGLADSLGPAAAARYRPGVRALLVGPSGTGKTLACGWLATRLGLPLYRVDLASVTSKYIGETEKNLGELFARAEHAEVMLLFDEADAVFGKRTEVKDSNDRFANQQTNYLLQRIESFDGIAVLTSNSRSRFDSAFTRRLDAIVEFPAPGPQERRALWLAHLGRAHALDPALLNRLASACDLPGGHIRNVTLAAAALAPREAITWSALTQSLAAEYRKLGKPVPAALAAPAGG